MKKKLLIPIIAGAVLLFVAAMPQQHQGAEKLDHPMQMHVMEMSKDSTMMDVMMDRIASDQHLAMMMMSKMIHHAKTDSMMQNHLCRMMVDDADMHSMMMKYDGGRKMNHDGMMNHSMMHGNSSEAGKTQESKHETHSK